VVGKGLQETQRKKWGSSRCGVITTLNPNNNDARHFRDRVFQKIKSLELELTTPARN